jgi:hypothetical protein
MNFPDLPLTTNTAKILTKFSKLCLNHHFSGPADHLSDRCDRELFAGWLPVTHWLLASGNWRLAKTIRTTFRKNQ